MGLFNKNKKQKEQEKEITHEQKIALRKLVDKLNLENLESFGESFKKMFKEGKIPADLTDRITGIA